MSEDRLKRLEELQQQASESLGLDISHERVQGIAALRLAHEGVVERLVVGGGGDHAATTLLNLSEAIAKLSPAPAVALPKIEVVYVENAVGLFKCQHCHAENRIENYVAPPAPPSPATTIEGEIISEPATAAAGARSLPPPKVKHPNDEPRRDPGSIHDSRLNGVPARMRRTDYSAVDPNAGANGAPVNRAGVPDVGRYHASPWPILDV
jgi:hypothetical protein